MGEYQSTSFYEAREPASYLAELDELFAEGALVPSADVARYLNISLTRLTRLGDTGRIRYQLKGYGWRYFSRHDVERFLMIDGYPLPEEAAPVEKPRPVAVSKRPQQAGTVIDLAAARARLRG